MRPDRRGAELKIREAAHRPRRDTYSTTCVAERGRTPTVYVSSTVVVAVLSTGYRLCDNIAHRHCACAGTTNPGRPITESENRGARLQRSARVCIITRKSFLLVQFSD